MHKVLDEAGEVTSVTMTADEWRRIHSDYKVARPERQALVLCPRRGTILVPATITATGMPEEAGQ
ncbi:MAG: hypothetical protein REI11_14700 [Patulibacter sp.]|nr:hypothetical protein [Patulibacter sp.]